MKVFPLSGCRAASSSRSLAGYRSWSMHIAAIVSLPGVYNGIGAQGGQHQASLRIADGQVQTGGGELTSSS